MKLLSTSKDYVTRKQENIDTAKQIAKDSGLTNISFSNYSDTNGVSVYLRCDETDKKVRVSDHTVKNKDRIFDELHLSFDKRTIGKGGKKGFKSNEKTNILSVERELKK